MCWAYLPVRSLYPCSVEEHAAASRLQCPCGKQPWLFKMRATGQCRKDRGWHDAYFFHFCIKKLPIFLQNIQSSDGATRATPQWSGRPEAVLLTKDPSRSWRRKLRASAGALNGVFGQHNDTLHGFLFELRVLVPCNCRKHRVIHGYSQKVLGSMSPNLDGCPPKKLAVWCDSWSLWDSEFCIFTATVGKISHISHYIDEILSVFSNLTYVWYRIPSLLWNFLRGLSVGDATRHQHNLWFQALPGSCWSLVTFDIMRCSFWRIQGFQDGCSR